MLSVACGGDDGSGPSASTMSDAGTKTDTAMDGGGTSTGTSMIPRRDAQVSNAADPIAPCTRDNPNSCGSGEVCDVLIRAAPTDMNFTVYTGCVKATTERGEGDPCDPDITAGEQYMAEGLTDVVFRDPCGPGLVCAQNRKIRGAYSCQTACSTGRIDGAPFACSDVTTICAVSGTRVAEFCRKTDGCNVEKQTGCLGGESCYLIPSDDNEQLLSLCSGTPDMPTADNMPCQSLVSCKGGSVCLGPARTPISAWTNENLMCRPVCNGQMGTAPDAMADEDAGVSSGLCSSTTRCQAFSESGLKLSSIPTPPFGQCESQ